MEICSMIMIPFKKSKSKHLFPHSIEFTQLLQCNQTTLQKKIGTNAIQLALKKPEVSLNTCLRHSQHYYNAMAKSFEKKQKKKQK